jgi:hypothetical protein
MVPYELIGIYMLVGRRRFVGDIAAIVALSLLLQIPCCVSTNALEASKNVVVVSSNQCRRFGTSWHLRTRHTTSCVCVVQYQGTYKHPADENAP